MERPGGDLGAGAGRPVPVHRASGTRGILDDGQPAGVGEGTHVVQVDGHAALVDRDDRPGRRRHRCLDGGRRDIAGERIHVGEHRAATGMDHGIGRRDEGERRHHHVIPRTNAGDDQ